MEEELWCHEMTGPFRLDNMLRCHTLPLTSKVLDQILQTLGVHNSEASIKKSLHNCMVIQVQI